MIRALRSVLGRTDVREALGLVVLFAFLLAVVVSAAHAAEPDHDGHDLDHVCSVCAAAQVAFAGETLVGPQLLDRLAAPAAAAAERSAQPNALEPRRQHAPRAPPHAA